MSQRKMFVVGIAGIVVALATAGTALALDAQGAVPATDVAGCGTSSPKLTVQGTGLATSAPDLLTVSVGIAVTDSTAQASLADDNSRAAAVTAALKQGGTVEKDVQTSDLSIQPSFNDKGVIIGYDVANTLTVKLRNFSTAGSIIDSLASAAGNSVRIDSLTFSIEDPRSLEDQAREQAVHQAVSHAKSMARAAGERLGPVCSLGDVTPIVPQGVTFNQAAAGFANAGVDHVPLAPGSQQASAQVTIVYSLVP